MNGRPAIKLLLPLAAGIVAGRVLRIPPLPAFILTAALFTIALTAAAAAKRWGRAATVLLPLTVCSFGALLLSMDLHFSGPRDLGRALSADTVVIEGTVLDPQGRSERSARFVVACRAMADARGVREVEGKFTLTLSGNAMEEGLLSSMVPGRDVVVRGVLRPPSRARNPGEVDWAAWYELAGISARMSVRHPADVVPGGLSSRGFVNAFVLPVRRTLSEHLRSFVDDREARFLNGLILGERNEVPSDLKSDFVTVGVMHLLAISGQQVVIVALLLAALLTILRVPEKPRFFLVAAALGYYVLLTGASPSVTRAGIMSVVLLGSKLIQRRADIFNALGISAVLILLASPRQLFDPGFLLSFAAVLAIVLLYPVIIGAAPGLTARFARFRVLDLAWKGAAVSLAAGLGTAPIVAWFFGRVSLVGFLANILIVPLSSLALVLGMLTVAASFVSAWVASVYAAGAEASAWLTFRLVEFFAGFPYAMVGFRLSMFAVVVIYAWMVLFLKASAEKTWKPLIVGSIIIVNVVLFAWVWRAPPRDVLRITFLDVGQGDATLVEFPGGATMLVDGGPVSPTYDAGERVILPFLEREGIGKIDLVVVTHPHSDHLGGIPSVLRAIPVGMVVDGGTESRSSLYREYRKVVDSLGLPRRVPSTGETIGDLLPARVYVFWPDTLDSRGMSGMNEQSIVLGLRYGATTALLAGDAEDGAEAAMADRYGDFLRSDILKAGHHGSLTSSTPGFISLVSPTYAVISVGEFNSFGHPSPGVVGRYADMGSSVARTDLSGAVVFESDGTEWERVEWRE